MPLCLLLASCKKKRVTQYSMMSALRKACPSSRGGVESRADIRLEEIKDAGKGNRTPVLGIEGQGL